MMIILLNKKVIKYFALVVTIAFILGISTILVLSFSSSVYNQETTLSPKTEKGIAVPIIMYHSMVKSSNQLGPYMITPNEFENDLKYLNEHNYSTVNMSDLINYVYYDGELPSKPVVITFDDGNLNNLIYGEPLLKKYGMKAVVSVVGKYSDDSSGKDKDYSYATWEQLKAMNDSGIFEIQNHTYDLHKTGTRNGAKRRKGESLEDYRKFLISDIGRLQQKITEITGTTPNTIAYPFGSYNKDTEAIIKEMGFKASLSCEKGVNYIDKNKEDILFCLKRNNRPHGVSTSVFFKKICP